MSLILSTIELERLTKTVLSNIQNSQYLEASELLQFALSNFDKTSPSYYSIIGNMSYLLTTQGHYKKVLNLLSKIISTKPLLESCKIGLMVNLACAYSSANNHESSLKYLLKALSLADLEKYPEIRSVVLFNLAVEYIHLNDISKSLQFFEQGWSFSNTIPNNFIISKLLLKGCSYCLNELHFKQIKITKKKSLQFLEYKRQKSTTKCIDSSNSSHHFSLSDEVKGKISLSNSSVKSNYSLNFDFKNCNSETGGLENQVKNIRNGFGNFLNIVSKFCMKNKQCLKEVYSSEHSFYLEHLDKILVIQRFVRKNSLKKIRFFKTDFKFFNHSEILKTKLNNKIFSRLLPKYSSK